MSVIEHGSPAGYRAELRAGVPTCESCRAAHNAANRAQAAANPRKLRRTGRPVGRPVGSCYRRDEVLAEWEYWCGRVSFEEFAPKVGMTVAGWTRMYQRARAAGDRRAVRDQSPGRWAA